MDNVVPSNLKDNLKSMLVGESFEGFTLMEEETEAFPCGIECCGVQTFRWKVMSPTGELIEITDG